MKVKQNYLNVTCFRALTSGLFIPFHNIKDIDNPRKKSIARRHRNRLM